MTVPLSRLTLSSYNSSYLSCNIVGLLRSEFGSSVHVRDGVCPEFTSFSTSATSQRPYIIAAFLTFHLFALPVGALLLVKTVRASTLHIWQEIIRRSAVISRMREGGTCTCAAISDIYRSESPSKRPAA